MSTLKEKVIGMDGKPFEPKVVEGTVKLKIDGTPKKTHPNPKTGGTTWVDPIKSEDDIEKIVNFLQNKVDNESRADYRKGYARNKLYFCVAVFSGFRVS